MARHIITDTCNSLSGSNGAASRTYTINDLAINILVYKSGILLSDGTQVSTSLGASTTTVTVLVSSWNDETLTIVYDDYPSGYSSLTDSCATVQSVLSNAWDSSNTNSRTPEIVIYKNNPKKVNFQLSDKVAIYAGEHTIEPNGFGANSARVIENVYIIIMTKHRDDTDGYASTHALKMVNEVFRILSGSIINPDANYEIVNPLLPYKDLCDGMDNMGKYEMRAQLLKTNITW